MRAPPAGGPCTGVGCEPDGCRIGRLRTPFHRAFALHRGIHTKIRASVFHRKGGPRFGRRLAYPESVRPVREALTPLRVLPTFQPGVRPYTRHAGSPRGARLALLSLSHIRPAATSMRRHTRKPIKP
eukprot:362104-Chlamydomonas_euryale.AAC.3